jgi:hypothetical protein
VQRVRFPFDGHLALGHGFQQGTLGLWRGAVDLVRKYQLGKNGPGMELELLLVPAVNGDPQNVSRQQVAGKLDALILGAEHRRQGMSEGGLAHARQVFDEQMSLGQEATKRQLNLGRLGEQNAVNRVDGFMQAFAAAAVMDDFLGSLTAHGLFLQQGVNP